MDHEFDWNELTDVENYGIGAPTVAPPAASVVVEPGGGGWEKAVATVEENNLIIDWEKVGFAFKHRLKHPFESLCSSILRHRSYSFLAISSFFIPPLGFNVIHTPVGRCGKTLEYDKGYYELTKTALGIIKGKRGLSNTLFVNYTGTEDSLVIDWNEWFLKRNC